MGEARYVIAPRREARQRVDPAWQAAVRGAPGVTVVGGDDQRLHVAAAPEAADALRARLGDDFHVEAVAPRRPGG